MVKVSFSAYELNYNNSQEKSAKDLILSLSIGNIQMISGNFIFYTIFSTSKGLVNFLLHLHSIR